QPATSFAFTTAITASKMATEAILWRPWSTGFLDGGTLAWNLLQSMRLLNRAEQDCGYGRALVLHGKRRSSQDQDGLSGMPRRIGGARALESVPQEARASARRQRRRPPEICEGFLLHGPAG